MWHQDPGGVGRAEVCEMTSLARAAVGWLASTLGSAINQRGELFLVMYTFRLQVSLPTCRIRGLDEISHISS